MATIHLALLILAFILFLAEAIQVRAPKIILGWLGLAIWMLAILLSEAR